MHTNHRHLTQITMLGRTALAAAVAAVLAGGAVCAMASPVTTGFLSSARLQPITAAQSAIRVMFIDARVPDSAALIRAAMPGTRVVRVDPDRDGLQQVATWLGAHPGAASVALVAHGAPGELLLGARVLDHRALQAHGSALARIGQAMTPGADLLLYTCDSGAGATGLRFVRALAAATGHDVAASNDVTGKDGDWTLEVSQGQIDQASMLSDTALVGYDHDLALTVVGNLDDSGPGSLRQAIVTTTGNNVADTIVFDPALFSSGPQTLTLTSGGLDVSGTGNNDAFDIEGPGASLLTISGGNASQIFMAVHDHTDHSYYGANTSALTLSGMTLANGYFTYTQYVTGYGGAAIVSDYSGDLTLDHVVISSNQVSGSGFNGGGVEFDDKNSLLTISHSTFASNSAAGQGGALSAYASSVTITNSTFVGNTATRSGGAATVGADSGITIVNDTFFNNTAGSSTSPSERGGALDIEGSNGTLRVVNSTITGNHLLSAVSGTSGGGGLFVRNNTVGLYNNLITNNTSETNGPDVLLYQGGVINGSNNIIGTAVDTRSSQNNPGTNNLTGTVTTLPTMGALAYNGGAVKTIAIDAGGSAANAGIAAQAPATDARGYQRGSSVDIGAYEANDNNNFEFSGSFYPPNGYPNFPNAGNLSLDFGQAVTAVAGKNIVIHLSGGSVFETIPATDAR
ncbi:MAG: DUF4347 domain-containing protein, partial [Xanthomonadales bacterium]|nr:DUF4347 domain-containing protein [Xanthomonadales bacterium]